MNSNITAACSIYCNGDVLRTIQLSQIFTDSKEFVDMPMRADPEEVLYKFYATFNISDPNSVSNTSLIAQFLSENFDAAGSDLIDWTPDDYHDDLEILTKVKRDDYKEWVVSLNKLWLLLGRQVSSDVLFQPQRHSFLPRYYPMIVPGGRFRESYYWDSWFIVRGLLVCDMHTTALNVLNNFFQDIKNFGFVPNGGRIYYLDRSQPPVLSEMVFAYCDYMLTKFGLTNEIQSFIDEAFDVLLAEYDFWMNEFNGHVVSIGEHKLNRYFSSFKYPRPESFEVDYTNAANMNLDEQLNFYRNIRAGAESGWDFSSRWFTESSDLKSILTSNIIPVELNSFMYKFEINLSKLSTMISTKNQTMSVAFSQAATIRAVAINSILWDDESSFWRDLNSVSLKFTTNCLSISSWIPMWAGLTPPSKIESVILSLSNSNLIQSGGILTTSLNTGQQWDAPNAWPPLVLLTVEGLQVLNTPASHYIAESIRDNWLGTCFTAFNNSGYMYEKYNALEYGHGGGGGEYVPQIGFGWSNAVVLVLLNQSSTPSPVSLHSESMQDSNVFAKLIATPILAVASIILLVWYKCFYSRRVSKKSLLTFPKYQSLIDAEQ